MSFPKIPMYDDPISNSGFLSIIILSYRRPEYTKRLLESIHRHKDCIVEIILFDDASPEEDQIKIYNEMRHMVSSIVFNTGQPEVNGGYCAAANRAVALTNSEYILLLNNDLEMVGPGFQAIKAGLDLPFVGCLGPSMGMEISRGPRTGEGVCAHINNIDLLLTSIPQSSGLFAFRRDVWQRVGGFPYVYHNNADTAFHHIVLKHSLFNATILNHPKTFRNVDQEDGYINATHGKTPFDQSYPHLLGIPYDQFRQLCVDRKNKRYPESHRQYQIPFGLNNIQSWGRYFREAEPGDNTYNWEKLSAYEQNKWRDVINEGIKAWNRGN